MKKLVGFIVVSAVLLVTRGGLCHDGRGGLTLEPQASTRAVSLGETGLLETGSAEGFAVNPSCLPLVGTTQVGLARGNIIQGISSSVTSLAIAVPFGQTIEHPGSGPIARAYGVGLSIDHRSFELAQGSSWSSETISLGLGRSLTPYASVGAVAKMLLSSSDVDHAGATAYGLDVAGRLDMDPRISVSMVVRNIVGSANWDGGQDESLPITLSLAGTVALPYDMCAELALIRPANGGGRVGGGVDAPIMMTGFHLRAGYARRLDGYSRNVFTAGFGFRHLRYRLAYAVRLGDESAFGRTHHFSLATGLW